MLPDFSTIFIYRKNRFLIKKNIVEKYCVHLTSITQSRLYSWIFAFYAKIGFRHIFFRTHNCVRTHNTCLSLLFSITSENRLVFLYLINPKNKPPNNPCTFCVKDPFSFLLFHFNWWLLYLFKLPLCIHYQGYNRYIRYFKALFA